MKNKGLVFFEWPAHCDGWNDERIVGLIRGLGLSSVKVDGCMLGFKGMNGHSLKKPLCILTNCKEFVARCGNLTCDNKHKHEPCSGRNTNASSHYTDKFAKIILESIEEHWAKASECMSLVCRNELIVKY